MRLALASFVFVCLPACAVSFTPGTAPMPPPGNFKDTDDSAQREERKTEEATGSAWAPTVGMSLVVGGERMDAGNLPKPPVPMVALP
ncbi:MAG: hypothetical protein ACLQVI_14855 [Polyangiaceae bacterium]